MGQCSGYSAADCTHTHSRAHTHTLAPRTRCDCGGCYSRTEARFKPRDSAGLIKEHISICSHSASTQCSLYRLHKTHTWKHNRTCMLSFPPSLLVMSEGQSNLANLTQKCSGRKKNTLHLEDARRPLTMLSCGPANEVQKGCDPFVWNLLATA